MHEAPASLPDMNSPSVMAGRLRRNFGGVEAYADGYLEFECEASRPTDKPRHMQRRYYETLLTHIRRAEYQLRCFILWLAAILIEKAQANPEFFNAVIGTPQVNSLEHGLCNPNGLRDQTKMLQAQAVEPKAKIEAEHNHNNQPTGLAWQQELELRRLTAKTPPIGGFTVTTPVFETGKRGSTRVRVKAFRPDPLSIVDASYLIARMARLPRILARADQIAERLARRAALSAFYREGRAEAENYKNPALSAFYRESRAGAENYKNSALSAFYRASAADAENNRNPALSPFYGAGSQISQPIPNRRDGLPTVSVAQARARPPNPLWFQPFQHWLPPEDLWASSEDEGERADLNWLHHVAVGALTRVGLAPGDDPASRLPDLSRFEPPSPPQIRRT
ncbi:hypothetical protein [Ponticaulis sp.]|uniref:hypothetical protein n=1 Tax=Ponticaulis sp. TaxID=2020902 RepID=UPI00260CFB9A|nr:hypothetical protein [Ponticaulis sp.]MDF1680299.1 hypothetical protein [Ponticaulis sp.]